MAGDKYVALVADMYGEGQDLRRSADLAGVDDGGARRPRRRAQARQRGDGLPRAEADKRGIGDSAKKAAVGFCFGGGNMLELARSGADVNAVVCLHGDLATTMPAKKGDIKAAVFVIHGSKDPVAPKADRDALEAELDGAGANWQMLDFGGRLHSFAEEETMMKGVAEYNAPPRTRPSGCSTTSSRTRSTRSSDNVFAVAARRAPVQGGRAALYLCRISLASLSQGAPDEPPRITSAHGRRGGGARRGPRSAAAEEIPRIASSTTARSGTVPGCGCGKPDISTDKPSPLKHAQRTATRGGSPRRRPNWCSSRST
jgi:dienelactone hydrolase